MHILTHSERLEIDSERLVRRIPFFNSVYESSSQQFSLMMDLAEIIRCEPGETIIRKDDNDMKLYFLLKGQLEVYLDNGKQGNAISSINPGEVFGILSMVTNTRRSAFIRSQDNKKASVLFSLDFSYISDANVQSKLHTDTKLIFYRMAVHNIRWTLELNKMSDPNNILVAEIRKVPVIHPGKGGEEELVALKEQAKAMSDLLFQWNASGKSGS